MTAIGKHPWGTSTSLAMFDGCLLEIMGMYDASLIDEVPAGDFHFGRHVYEHLQQREGVALTALHSTNSVNDAQLAIEAGFRVAGHLEFGRDVNLPGGKSARTKTTLALLPSEQFPRLSFFLCQQHRPELIYVPEWLEHPNSVNGIGAINLVAPVDDWDLLKQHFGGLYGAADEISGGFEFETANGVIRTYHKEAYQKTVGPLPESVLQESTPCIVGMDFVVQNVNALISYLNQAGIAYERSDNAITANTLFRFYTGVDEGSIC